LAVRFQQWVNNFDATTVEGTSTSTIDSLGFITSVTQSAADASDQATRDITSNMPTSEEGRARFYYSPVAIPVTPTGNYTIFGVYGAAAAQILEVYFSTARVLSVFSPAGRLSSGSINFSCSPSFVDGVEHLIEVAWKKNGFLKVWVDGIQTLNLTTLSGSAGSCVPVTISVGVNHYDGADASGLTVKHRLFQYGDATTDILVDPNTVIPDGLIKKLNMVSGAGAWQLVGNASVATSSAQDGQRLAELVDVAKACGYVLAYTNGLLVANPR